MTCPVCGATCLPGVRTCRWCHVALAPDGTIDHPAITVKGGLVATRDFRTDPLPGRQQYSKSATLTYEPTASGSRVWVASTLMVAFMFERMTMRDAYVRTIAVTDDNGRFGIIFRSQVIGDNTIYYLLQLRTNDRAYRFVRACETPKSIDVTPIRDWIVSSAIHASGQANELVLAAYGGSVQLWINQASVYRAHAPELGAGGIGLYLGAGDARGGGTTVVAGIDIALVSA